MAKKVGEGSFENKAKQMNKQTNKQALNNQLSYEFI